MAYDIGPKLGIDGEAQFKSAISAVTANIKALGAEMKAVTAEFSGNEKSMDALASKNAVLEKQISATKDQISVLTSQFDKQKSKLDELGAVLEQAREKFGDNSEEAAKAQIAYNRQSAECSKLQTQINSATASLTGMTNELSNNERSISDLENAADGAAESMGDLSSSTKDADTALDDAKGSASDFADKLKSGLAAAAKAAAAAVAAVTAAAGAMVGAVVTGVSSLAETGDNIDKMSQKLGMSAEAYQEWDFIMQHCGASIDSMQSSMKTLANAAEKGNDAFSRLGMSQEEINRMSQEDLFSATIAALQNVSDETERTYLAGQLLGKGATELGPLLNTSAQDVEAMRRQVHELGGVMSNESVAAAATFQDSLQNLQTAVQGMGRGALADFLPSVTQVMDGLTALVTGDSSGLALISQGLDDFTANLSSVIPTMLETGGTIVQSLLGAITENLPQVIESGAGVLMEFANGILELLPELAEAALEIVTTLASGIADSLPELVPTVVDVVLQIVETLTDPENLDNVIGAALEIVTALATGLINALPTLAERVPEIIGNIVSTLAENLPDITGAALTIVTTLAEGLLQAIPELVTSVPDMVTAIADSFAEMKSDFLDIGNNIVTGVWQGINDKAKWIKEKVSGFFSGIVSGVKSTLGINSPSKVFAGIGGYMAEGLEQGFGDEMGAVQRSIDRSMAELAGNARGTVRMEAVPANGLEPAGTANSSGTDSIVTALRQALEGMDVYLDGRRVGQLVSSWQNNDNKAWAR